MACRALYCTPLCSIKNNVAHSFIHNTNHACTELMKRYYAECMQHKKNPVMHLGLCVVFVFKLQFQSRVGRRNCSVPRPSVCVISNASMHYAPRECFSRQKLPSFTGPACTVDDAICFTPLPSVFLRPMANQAMRAAASDKSGTRSSTPEIPAKCSFLVSKFLHEEF